MIIKKFKCGLCKIKDMYIGSRKSLREHIKKEHSIMSEITNVKGIRNSLQDWWITEEFT